MVSGTDGSSTCTGWKRRSSAASFSMARYSVSVVAPIMRRRPRASSGLSMFAASIAPSAAPAPTTVWSSSMKVMMRPSDASISLSTALSRSSNSPRYFAPATIADRSSSTSVLSLSSVGTSPSMMRRASPFDDRGLPDTRLADEHRVVLRAAHEHLDRAPDLLVTTDDRVEPALARGGGQVARVLGERLVGRLGVGRGDALRAADRLQRLEQPVASRPRCRAAPRRSGRCPEHREHEVLGRHVLVAECRASLSAASSVRTSASLMRASPVAP
jgi:hypothetical protein